MVGEWKVEVNVGGMPQKVATAMGEINMLGAEYEPIAYLGSQVVNGVNHAVLAEQIVITGRDTKNIVVLKFNEKPNDMKVALVGIETVVSGGAEFGGIALDVKTDIPEDAKTAWDEAFKDFVGSDVKPFAYLGSQVVNGMNYIFAAEVTPVVPDPVSRLAVVTVNTAEKHAYFGDLLKSKQSASLGYAFTW